MINKFIKETILFLEKLFIVAANLLNFVHVCKNLVKHIFVLVLCFYWGDAVFNIGISTYTSLVPPVVFMKQYFTYIS